MTQLTAVPAADLAELVHKVDALTGEVQRLNGQLQAQRQAQQGLEDLAQDLTPVVNQAFKSLVRELAEVDGQFRGEELVHLLKRLLANTRRFNVLLDLMESGLDLLGEAERLGRPALNTAAAALDQLERQGYFVFAQEGARMANRVVAEFTPEDARALGDNLVTILRTVRNMTQPDIMALANQAVDQLHQPEPDAEAISVWSLVRDLNDPRARRGLARLLRVLKTLADSPGGPAGTH